MLIAISAFVGGIALLGWIIYRLAVAELADGITTRNHTKEDT